MTLYIAFAALALVIIIGTAYIVRAASSYDPVEMESRIRPFGSEE
jgi:uncharacterized membrane protein (DUF485 family)